MYICICICKAGEPPWLAFSMSQVENGLLAILLTRMALGEKLMPLLNTLFRWKQRRH